MSWIRQAMSMLEARQGVPAAGTLRDLAQPAGPTGAFGMAGGGLGGVIGRVGRGMQAPAPQASPVAQNRAMGQRGVMMRAPDGSMQEVSPQDVEHYRSRGAQMVG